MAGRHELVVREGDRRPVHPEALRKLTRRGQLHPVAELTVADETLEMRLDLAGECHGLLAIERDMQGCHGMPFS